MMRHTFLFALVAVVTVAVGCVTACDDVGVGSVTVTVSDPDGNPIPDVQVGYLPADEDWTDYEPCDRFENEDSWVCGWEVAGEIEIEVTADGFQLHVEAVVVDEDPCHVIPEQLDVELQPTT
jgi:hypothetical protein